MTATEYIDSVTSNVEDEDWWGTTESDPFKITNDGIEIINLGAYIYESNYYLDKNKYHSFYTSWGDIDAYLGIDINNGGGVDIGASLVEFGYDGRLLDVEVDLLSIGLTSMYKDGMWKDNVGFSPIDVSFSFDFPELIEILSS